MTTLYESISLFEPIRSNSKKPAYRFANGAPGIALMTSVGDEADIAWEQKYKDLSLNNNLYEFMNRDFYQNESSYHSDYFACFYNPIPFDLLAQAMQLPMEKVSPNTILRFISINRSKRHDTFCSLLKHPGLKIRDVSQSGFRAHLFSGVITTEPLKGKQIIQIGPNLESHVEVSEVWRKDNEMGCKILKCDSLWEKFIFDLENHTKPDPIRLLKVV
jgi:hypothetical protein